MRLISRPVLGAALLFLLTATLATGPGLLPGRTTLPVDVLGLFAPWHETAPPPTNVLLGDPVLQFSARLAVRDALRAGRLPAWDPRTMAGHPLDGDTHVAPLAPLHLLSALWPDSLRAYDLQRLLQLWLAGLFAWLWLRQLVAAPFAALLAALSWQLAGYHLAWQAYLPFMGTLMWLPAAAAAWEQAARSGDRRAVPAGGLALGAAIAGGQLQFVVEGVVVLAAIALARIASFDRARRRRAVMSGLAMGALGLAIGAAHLLPSLAQARESIRPPFTWEALRQTGLPWRHLTTLLAPGWLGGPGQGVWRGAQNAAELAVYVGLPALAISLAGLARRDPAARRLLAPVLLVAALALATPVARPLAALPLLQRLGLMRWLAVWPLALAPWLAVALATPLERPDDSPRMRHALLALSALGAGFLGLLLLRDGHADAAAHAAALRAAGLLAASTAALWLYLRHPRDLTPRALLLALVVVDLLAFGRPWAPGPPRATAFAAPPNLGAIAAERAAGDPFRVAVLQTGQPILLGPGVAPSLGLDTLGGYSSSVRDSWRAVIAALAEPPDNPHLPLNPNMISFGETEPVLLRLLNVRYVLAGTTLDGDDGGLDLAVVGRDDGLVIHRAPPSLGPAWLLPADAVRAVPDQAAALAAVAAPGFDPARELPVEEPGAPAEAPSARGLGSAIPGAALLSFNAAGPDRRVLRVHAPPGAWLVLSEAWAAGWRATVDGKPARVVRAYGAIQAVQLPEGPNSRKVDVEVSEGAPKTDARTIVFYYRPAARQWGLAISALGLIAALAWAVGVRHRVPDSE
jgi:hypothetical protein